MLDHLQLYESEFVAAVSGRADEQRREFLSKIKKKSRISPQLAVEIYRNNTQGARVAALEQIYPACASVVGSSVFRAIAREFVANDEYGSADLNTYGGAFHRRLQHLLSGERLPADLVYLADLARLEYLLHQAYYADDDPLFDFNDFEQTINDGIDISFHASHSLGLIDSGYPLHQIWMNNVTQQCASRVNAINATQYLVVYRDGFKPRIEAVDDCTYLTLVAITKACSLQQLVERSGCDITRILPDLISRGWVTGISKHG